MKRTMRLSDLRRRFKALRELCDDLKGIVRDHDSGYGGTYDRDYFAEREENAWRELRALCERADRILNLDEEFLEG